MSKYFVYCDGGARGNPGPAGIGVVIFSEKNKPLKRISKYIGETTNNQAEYRAVIAALNEIPRLDRNPLVKPEIQVFLDSQLIVEQMNGRYKIKNENLKPLYWQIRDLIMQLGGGVVFEYIPREKNKEADKLVNEAIDQAVK